MSVFSIPVLYYHRVGAPDPVHLSMPVTVFEAQMAFLARRGYRTLSASEFMGFISGRTVLNKPAVFVTFDDGFRDNLINALPILRKYGHKASVFMATSLIRGEDELPGDAIRSFSAAHAAARMGDKSDFLSTREIETMAGTGIFEFFPHGHAHSQVFTDSTVVGLYPDTDDHWGILSAYGQPAEIPRLPVFPRQAGLTSPAWFPIMSEIIGARGLWDDHSALSKVRLPESCFRIENLCDYEERVTRDLSVSMNLMRKYHPDDCDLICWPWGAENASARAIARKLGYNGALLTSAGCNIPGMDPFQIRRFAVKKKNMLHFATGLWIRFNPTLAGIYGRFHRKF